MSLSQGYSVVNVLFLPVLYVSGSDCTIVTLGHRFSLIFADFIGLICDNLR
jgi:hypothetical protein